MLVTLCVTSVAHKEGLFPAGQDIYRHGSLSLTHSVSHSLSLFLSYQKMAYKWAWPITHGRG